MSMTPSGLPVNNGGGPGLNCSLSMHSSTAAAKISPSRPLRSDLEPERFHPPRTERRLFRLRLPGLSRQLPRRDRRSTDGDSPEFCPGKRNLRHPVAGKVLPDRILIRPLHRAGHLAHSRQPVHAAPSGDERWSGDLLRPEHLDPFRDHRERGDRSGRSERTVIHQALFLSRAPLPASQSAPVLSRPSRLAHPVTRLYQTGCRRFPGLHSCPVAAGPTARRGNRLTAQFSEESCAVVAQF